MERVYWRLRQRYTTWHAYNRLQRLVVDVIPGRRVEDAGGRVLGRLETLRLNYSVLTARGWLFATDGPVRGVTLSVQVGPVEHNYPMVYGIHRDDVTEAHPTLASPHVGFVLSERVLFPLRGMMRLDVRLDDGTVTSFDLGSYNLLKHPGIRRWRRWGFASFYVRRIIPELPNYLNAKTRATAKRRISRRLDPSRFHPPSERLIMRELLVPATHRSEPLDFETDIIVPVYNGMRLLPDLFDRIERHTTSPYRLIVVDDASPDAEVRQFLDKLGSRPAFRDRLELIRNPVNLGFVGSVNKGMTLVDKRRERRGEAAGSHVVLLNTDARVPAGWLERLMAPIAADPNVASTTPFSNSATICSFPNFCQDNSLALGLTTDETDAFFRRLSPSHPLTAMPTGVGFCMGMSRAFIERLGTFDAETFGPGYAEENDWCQRAIKAGGRNVMVHNLFVEHQHGGTFPAETRRALIQRNLRKLNQMHPNYRRDVDTYIVADPARGLRGLVLAMMALERSGKSIEIVIDHDKGGGANKYRNQRIEDQLGEGRNSLLVTAVPEQQCYRVHAHVESYKGQFVVGTLAELGNLVPDGPRVTWFYNCAVGYHDVAALLAFLGERAGDKGNQLVASLHDYFPICPSYCLLGANGRHCGLPDQDECARCLPRNKHAQAGTLTDIGQWRELWGRVLGLSQRVIVFSPASAKLFTKAYPALAGKVVLEPHTVPKATRPFVPRQPATPQGPFNVAVVGAIGYPKGAALVAEAAKRIDEAKLPIKLIVIGKLDRRIDARCVEMSGMYKPQQLLERLENHDVHVAWFPSIWPETFSFVTSELMEVQCPLVCFDLGAPAERVRGYAKGLVIDMCDGGAAIERIRTFAEQQFVDATPVVTRKLAS